MAKVLKTVAIVVGVVALVATGLGAAVGASIIGGVAAGAAAGTAATFAGVTAATFAAVGTLAGVAATVFKLGAQALTKPPAVTISGNQNSFTASLDQGLPWLIGRTRSAGCAVHDITYDTDGSTNNAFQSFYGVWSADRCYQIEATQIDSVTVDFSSANATAAGFYKDWMWHRSQLGLSPESGALKCTDALNYPPGWGPSAKLSGMAAFSWTLRFDPKGTIYPSGTIPQKRDILKGALAYDPRKDSTYPGGSGAHRADDDSTWEWTENPFLLGLKWARGIYSNGKRKLGIGMALAAINVDSAVQAANIADANGWKVGGVVYSTDPKYDVLKKICAAGSGTPLRVGGMLHFLVDAPKVSLDTITTDDLIGKCTAPSGARMKDRINGVIPTYREPSQDWQLVPATKVTVPAFITADGRPRTKAMTWELVQDASLVAKLATYAICNAREIDGIVLPCKVRWIGYKPGDAVTVSSSVVAMDSQLVVIRKRNLDPASGAVTFTCRTETTSKHAFALGQTTTPPPTPALATVDRTGLLQPGINASWSAIHDDDGGKAALEADVAALTADIAAIVSDGILSKGEKPQLYRDWNDLYQRWQALDAKAASLGIAGSQRSDATTKMNALAAYLNSLSPSWTDTTQDTGIVAATFQGDWTAATAAVAALNAAISGQPGAAGANGANGTDGLAALNIHTVGAVSWDGHNLLCTANAGNWGTNGAYSSNVIPGGVLLSFQRPNLYEGPYSEDAFVGISQTPSSSISYQGVDFAWRQGKNTGIGTSTYNAEVWHAGSLITYEGWDGSRTYSIRYDSSTGVVTWYAYDSTNGTRTIATYTAGTGLSFGLQAASQHSMSAVNVAFTAAGGTGAAGAPGVSPSPKYVAVNFNGPGSVPYPNPIPLENGQTLTFEAEIDVYNTAVTHPDVNASLQVQYSLNGGSTWTVMGSQSQTIAPGDDFDLDVVATYTNSSGAKQALNVRVVMSATGSYNFATGIMQPS